MMTIDMESVRSCFGVQIRSKVQQCYSLYHWVTNARGPQYSFVQTSSNSWRYRGPAMPLQVTFYEIIGK